MGRWRTLVAASIVGCGSVAPDRPPPSAPNPLVSAPAPAFRRVALDGTAVDTASRGQVMVVDFFAEHCAPCARSLPALESMHRAHPDVVVIGISEDDDAGGARRMAERHALTFHVVHDQDHTLAGRYRVVEMPATFVVDARGVVRWYGAAESERDLRAIVESAR